MDKSNILPPRPIIRLKHWIRRMCPLCGLEYLYPPATRKTCPRCGRILERISEGWNEFGITFNGRI